jgi:hypothetical protein
MAKKSDGMSESELVSLLDGAVTSSTNFGENSEITNQRNLTMKFLNGEVDFPAEDGHSSVVSHDVADTLHWILPALLRIFLGAENIGVYDPRRQDFVTEIVQDPQTGAPTEIKRDVSEDRAHQATDYINYVLINECRGYSVLHAALYDGLAFGNGLIKHWYDDSPEHITQSYSGLSDEAFTRLVDEDGVEVLEHTAKDDPDFEVPEDAPSIEQLQEMHAVALANGMPPEEADAALAEALAALTPPQVHAVKIKRLVSTGRLMVKALPNEEFFIGSDDLVIDETETHLCGHTYLETRSNLVKQGYDKDKVYDLPEHSETESSETTQNRRGFLDDEDRDPATERVRIYECYIRVDYDGDGVAELRRVVLGGLSGKRMVLENEEWGDDLPFTDLVPDPVPHRWRGRSVFDETADIQRIKTVLMRQTLDNLYQTNNPMIATRPSSVHNMDQLVNRKIGGLVFTDDPQAVNVLDVPFFAQQSFGMLDYMDRVRGARTGVNEQSMGLDMDALQNQTATAFNGAQSAAYAKMETYARNIAEVGMKRMFRCLLKLLVTKQDKTRMIRLRGKWTEMNPEHWHPDMDVTINTGLGSGSRERDMAMLGNILNEQKLIISQSGPMNPIADIRKYRDTLAKLVELAGFRSPDRYFAEITDDDWAKMQADAQQPKPDPAMAEAQARIEAEKAKQAADFELAQAKAQAQFQLDQQKAAMEAQLRQQEAAQKLQLMREEAAMKLQLRREEMELEAQLTNQANMAKMAMQGPAVSPDVNINGATL